VRHGVTEFNSTLKFQGHSDIELSADGYRQVEQLRDHLANEKIDAVYSPLGEQPLSIKLVLFK